MYEKPEDDLFGLFLKEFSIVEILNRVDHTVKIQGKLNNLQGIIFNFIIAYIFFKL